MFGRFQTDILPGLAAIVGSIDAVAVRDTPLAVVFARAHPRRQRILRIEHEATNRVRTLAIEYRRPGCSCIQSFPHAARGSRDEIVRRIAGIDCQTDYSS